MGELRGYAPESEHGRETRVFAYGTSAARIDRHGNRQDDSAPERCYSDDTLLSDPESGTFGAFDGVGGTVGGRDASREAAAVLGRMSREWKGLSAEEIAPKLREAVAEAHRAIRERGEREAALPGGHGMGMMATTACLVRMARAATGDPVAIVANVGDSRAYLLRRGAAGRYEMRRLTEDRNDFLGYGKDTPPEPEISIAAVHEGDRLLVVTDGILKNLSDEEMAYLVNRAETRGEDPASALVGHDSIRETQLKFASRKRHSTEVKAGPPEPGLLIGDDFSALVVECMPPDPSAAPTARPTEAAVPKSGEPRSGGLPGEMDRIFSRFMSESAVAPKIREEMERAKDPEVAERLKGELAPLDGSDDERLRMVGRLAGRDPGKAYGMLYSLGLDLSKGSVTDRRLALDEVKPLLLAVKRLLKDK